MIDRNDSEWEKESVILQVIEGEELDSGMHDHGHFELCYVLKGSGRFQIDAWSGDFRPGTLVVCPPRTLHSWDAAWGPKGRLAVSALVLRFTASALPSSFLKLPEMRRVADLREGLNQALKFEVADRDRLQARLRSIGRARGVLKMARFLVALDLMASFKMSQGVANDKLAGESSPRDQARVNRLRSWVEARAANGVSRKEAAVEAGLEEAAFSRFFHRATGQRFVDYVANVKVRQAATLLMNRRDLSLDEVARKSGFGSKASLHRQFKKWIGTTPDSYRKAANSEMLGP